jgi:hypothetical protein
MSVGAIQYLVLNNFDIGNNWIALNLKKVIIEVITILNLKGFVFGQNTREPYFLIKAGFSLK